jgi:hypothetical protein
MPKPKITKVPGAASVVNFEIAFFIILIPHNAVE